MKRDRDNKGRFVASMHCQYDDEGKELIDKNDSNYGEFYGCKRNKSIQIHNDDIIFTIHCITSYFYGVLYLF